MITDHRETVVWVLSLLFVGTFCGLWITVRQWQTGRTVIDRRQLHLRVLGLVDLMTLWFTLGLLLVWYDPRTSPTASVITLGVVLLQTLLLLIVGFVDWRLLTLQMTAAETQLALKAARMFEPDELEAARKAKDRHDA